MESTNPKVCVDQYLPDEMQAEALARASEENVLNSAESPLSMMEGATESAGAGAAAAAAPGVQELAIVTGKMWQPGRNLRVRFLGGQTAIQEKVIAYARQWLPHVDLNFTFGNDPQAEIRIAFASGGSWSYLGTDALGIAQNQATMNYGWLTPTSADDEYSRVVIHEFGHALGCIHEHQNPAGNIQWNKEAVYRYYMGPPNNWTKAQVDNNLFTKYDANSTQFSQLDPQSIMLYSIPAEFTTNGFSVGWNRVLSPMDKQYIQRWYPPYQARVNMTSQQYQQVFNELVGRGFRLASISGYNVAGQDRYAAVFMKAPYPGMTQWAARHGLNSQQYQQAFDNFAQQGYRLADVSGYELAGSARYAALWVKAPGPAYVARHGLTSSQYQQAFNQYVSQGYRLVHVSGYAVNNQAHYAAIWERNNGTAFVARHGLTSDQYQTAFNTFTAQGYRLTDVSGYAVGNQILYAAIWTRLGGPAYLARHGMSDYAQRNQQYLNQGLAPVRIDGYAVGNQDRYAGIWEARL